MDKKQTKQKPVAQKNASVPGAKGSGSANAVKTDNKATRQAKREAAKSINKIVEVLCTNGKKMLTRSSNGRGDEVTKIEIYGDVFSHRAWNPDKIQNVIGNDSKFAQKYGNLNNPEEGDE